MSCVLGHLTGHNEAIEADARTAGFEGLEVLLIANDSFRVYALR